MLTGRTACRFLVGAILLSNALRLLCTLRFRLRFACAVLPLLW